ncbi:MAG TPA: response regulator, partial [Accumulibacter sp.]|nr:response regulator [Accumulibacter sp.]
SNLLSNAIKFTTHGEVRVDVGVESRTGSAVMLSIKVSDTGMGIEASRQKTLFDSPRVSDSRFPGRRSSACLGLALVRQIINLMGGEVGVSSVAGQGSTFWLKLPVAVRGTQTAKQSLINGLSAGRLLIVNDNVLNRALLAQHLRNWGLRSRIAVNGRVALEALRQAVAIGSPFAVVVLDMLMADLDCLALIRSIRSDQRLDGLRIVVLTAFNRPVQMAAALSAGADGCLPQPIRTKQLFDTLQRTLGGQPLDEGDHAADADLRGLRLHVLLVEDDMVSREVALTTLEWLGCRTRAVTNGQDALKVYGQESFHLVLMDCHLPDLDGREVARRIRALENDALRQDVDSRRLPIIAVTANVLAGHRETCLQAGMDDYLAKPYDREGLLTVLHRWAPPEAAIPLAAPAAASERRLIDRKVLRTLGEVGNAAFVARVISLFIETMPEKLAMLEQAVSADDAENMARIARQIKSSAAALGLLGVVKAAAELENQSRISHLSKSASTTAALRTAYDDVLPTLNRLVTESNKSADDSDDAAATAA